MSLVLLAHSWLRWLVLIAGLVVLLRGIAGWWGHRLWSGADNGAGASFTVAMDIQAMLGIVLDGYFGSPTSMEHVGGMTLALVLAHVGRVRVHRASSGAAHHRTAVIFTGLSLLAMLGAIPWHAPLLRRIP